LKESTKLLCASREAWQAFFLATILLRCRKGRRGRKKKVEEKIGRGGKRRK
jgi:hypothetical protein